MCGIAGLIGLTNERNRSALKRMSDSLAHRGPDGDGFWESSADERGRGVMLAHRRLSVLDLSNAASQPMVDPTSGDVAILNGEIYNYVELRDELGAMGHTFASTGDTAVMLRALSVYGEAAVERLRGMFAFAYWNSRRRELMLARDPLGIKPLYIARNPDPNGEWSILFASEVRAILASGLLGTPRLARGAAASITWNGFIAGPDTAVAGIESVWPSESRVYGTSSVERSRRFYWSIPQPEACTRLSEDDFARELERCVKLHLASDVPLGVFLSGGVDSSAIANLAKRSSRAPVHTFTLAFEEAKYNEGDAARAIATAIGTEHQELRLTERHFIDNLEKALDSLDQPSFDGLNTYYMSHAVREAGFTVALVGTGGDEIFGGYTTFRDLPALYRWSRRTDWIPPSLRVGAARLVATTVQRGSGEVPRQTRWAKLPDMVRHSDDLGALYQFAYALFLPAFQDELLDPEARRLLEFGISPAMRARLNQEAGARTPLDAISALEQRLFLGERLLRDSDSTSMSASIEMRLPLVDHVLLEAAGGLSPALRYEPIRSKALLRRVGLRGLDPALFDRPKSGFVLPYDLWLKGALGRRIGDVMCDASAVAATGLDPQVVQRLWRAFLDNAPGLYWSRVWALYVFIRWCHRHRVLQ